MVEIDLEIDCSRERLDVEMIHRYLSVESYWATGIPRSLVERSIANSLCFGAYVHNQQVGFGRVITDYATFGYLADVFVLPAFRGQGISKRLMQAVMAHPDIPQLRRLMLATREAHALYTSFGFQSVLDATPLMQVHRTGLYLPSGDLRAGDASGHSASASASP